MKRVLTNRLTQLPIAVVGAALFILTCLSAVHADQQSVNDKQMALLMSELAMAPTQLEGRLAEDAIWTHWFNQSPSSEARALLDAAIERREAYDFEAAEGHLDELIALAPEYAEAYNQRAFIRFLRENYAAARIDLETTLEMEPNHFGALAGMYQIHSRNGDQTKAFEMLIKAVTLHPWLKERGGLPKAMWPKPYRDIHEPGQDI